MRLPIPPKLEVNVGTVQVKDADPILIPFALKFLVRILEYFESFGVSLHLGQSNAVVRHSLGFFVDHADALELLAGALSQHGCIRSDVELKIDFCFVEVAESEMQNASQPFEMRPYARERLQGFAITAAEE